MSRFVFISTCAVHDVILDDRPLDEAHPLWPAGHYGAHTNPDELAADIRRFFRPLRPAV